MEFIFEYKLRILNSFKDEGILKFLVAFIEVMLARSQSRVVRTHSHMRSGWHNMVKFTRMQLRRKDVYKYSKTTWSSSILSMLLALLEKHFSTIVILDILRR